MKIVHIAANKSALNSSNQIARILLLKTTIPHNDLVELSLSELKKKYPDIVTDTIENFIAQCHLSTLKSEYQKLYMLLGDPLV